MYVAGLLILVGGAAGYWFLRRDVLAVAVVIGGVILLGVLIWSIKDSWLAPSDVSTSYTGWQMPFPPHWHIGGVFLLGVGTFAIGLVLMFVWQAIAPAFFRGETLNERTPTLVPEDV